MAIRPEDILFESCPAKGTLSRRVQPLARGGEDITETFTRAGTAKYLSGTGYLLSASTNIPRCSHWFDGAVADPALIVEGARQNKCLQSEVFETSWTVASVTLTTNVTNAPDGNTTADRITENSSNSQHLIYQTNITITATATVAWSCYVRSTNRHLHLRVYDSAQADHFGGSFDLANGVVNGTNTEGGSGWITRLYIEALGNDWYRCVVTGGIGGGHTDIDGYIYMSNVSNTVTYTGDGASYVDIWGAQLEEGSFASSYIPTTTTAVTRGAELLSFPFYVQPQAMTIYAKFIEFGAVHPSVAEDTSRIIHIGDAASSAPRVLLYAANASQYWRILHNSSAGTAQAVLSTAPIFGDTVELLGVLSADGSVQLSQSINAGTATSTTQSAALALDSAWSDQVLWLGNINGDRCVSNPLIAVIVARGSHTLADFRACLP